MPVLPERLDEIEARVEAASPGPWFVERFRDGDRVSWQIPGVLRDRYGDNAITSDDEATIMMIAGARNDLADLVAEVRRLRGLLGTEGPGQDV